MKTFTVIYERDEADWWVADVPEIPGCHTQGQSVEEARERILNLNKLLAPLVGPLDIVSIQGPIRSSAHDEPEPDVAVLRPSAREHPGKPTAADIWFLVEVSDTSLQIDLGVKLPLYARTGIPEVWLVDVENEIITCHTDPVLDRYATSTAYKRGDTVVSTVLPTVRVAVNSILT